MISAFLLARAIICIVKLRGYDPSSIAPIGYYFEPNGQFNKQMNFAVVTHI
jgi:hypothetical protein